MIQNPNPGDKYRDNAGRYQVLFLREKKRLMLLSLLRLLVFAGGVTLVVLAFLLSEFAGIITLTLTVALFLFLIVKYDFHSGQKDFFENLRNINLNEIEGLNGDYSGFNNGSQWIDPWHDFSNDLDLFGPDSLFNYLNRTITGHGHEKLATWIASPFSISDKIMQRQEAISELSGKLEWRQEFIAHGTGRHLEKNDITGLELWLDDNPGFFSSVFIKAASWVLPGITCLSIILLIAGLIPYQVLTVLFLFNLTLIFFNIRETGRIHNMVSKKHTFLASLSKLLSTFEKESFNSEILDDFKRGFCSDDVSAEKKIKELTRIIQSFDNRLNVIVGFVLNGLLLWDFHCILSLEKWKREAKQLFPLWLDQIGEIDALISLGNYYYNNPAYSFPSVSTKNVIFCASEMGHPLIAFEKRVCNDFCIPGEGMIFIITGANMAGKSTFLRTVAVNFILAMTGSPVCARAMEFTPLNLFTSMRTTDSLTQNESYFYAELRRLKSLKLKLEEKERILFILDEILKGTNSNDKSRGSALFIRKIIELGGTGLIATHDNSIGELEKEFPGTIINKCFEIEIEGENISFDYLLREGITVKMNAALLMKQMGIV